MALIPCPHCRLDEVVCPHCEGHLRSRDGGIERTAAAVLLGLTVAGIGVGAAGCAPKYGGPPAPPPDQTSQTVTSATAQPSASAAPSAPAPPADVYGVAPSE